jgi:hypothetical protein
MKKKNRIVPFIISLILFVISLGYSFDAYCLEKTKKATWIKPLEKATLTVGKYTYEYTADTNKMYKGTFKILHKEKLLFTDKVGGVGQVTWKAEPKYLEPFQMITVNPKEPPVILFYSEIGQYDLEIRIYSTTEAKLLDVLHVGEAGAEIKDIDNDGILEFETINCFDLPLPPIDGNLVGRCTDAIYHFVKGRFVLAKGGKLRSLFIENSKREWQGFEKVYVKLLEIKNTGQDWSTIRKKYMYGTYRTMLGNLAAWLAQIENTADQEKIKEALAKLNEISGPSDNEKKEMIGYLSKAGYTGLALKE